MDKLFSIFTQLKESHDSSRELDEEELDEEELEEIIEKPSDKTKYINKARSKVSKNSVHKYVQG